MAHRLREKSVNVRLPLHAEFLHGALPLLVCVILGLAAACSSSGDNVGDMAKSLEDRLSEALQFDDGSLKTGTAPAAQSGGQAPQVVTVDFPSQLHSEIDFSVRIITTYSQPQNVTRAVVHVKGAGKYILVEADLTASGDKWLMPLYGKLAEDKQLAGKSFEIEYALQNRDGLTGAYISRTLKIADGAPQCESGQCCNGGRWIDADAPCFTSDELVCTEQSCDAAHECISSLIAETCLIADACYVPYDLNPENECEKCWPEEFTDQWSCYNSAPCDAGDGPESGYCDNGVCLAISPDGDFDSREDDIETNSDGDGEPEIDEEEAPAVWFDEQNGMTWESAASPDLMNQIDCSLRCDSLVLDGLSGWHIPSISELRRLIRNCEATVSGGACAVTDDCSAAGECRDESCDGCGGDVVCYTVDELAQPCGVYLSATLLEGDGSYIWGIDFVLGAINQVPWDEMHLCRCAKDKSVRAVAR